MEKIDITITTVGIVDSTVNKLCVAKSLEEHNDIIILNEEKTQAQEEVFNPTPAYPIKNYRDLGIGDTIGFKDYKSGQDFRRERRKNKRK